MTLEQLTYARKRRMVRAYMELENMADRISQTCRRHRLAVENSDDSISDVITDIERLLWQAKQAAGI